MTCHDIVYTQSPCMLRIAVRYSTLPVQPVAATARIAAATAGATAIATAAATASAAATATATATPLT